MKNVVTSLKKLKIVLSVLTVCKVLLKMSRDFRCEGSGHDAKLQKHYILELLSPKTCCISALPNTQRICSYSCDHIEFTGIELIVEYILVSAFRVLTGTYVKFVVFFLQNDSQELY